MASVEYHHVHLFVDELKPFDEYHAAEAVFNEFLDQADLADHEGSAKLFREIAERQSFPAPDKDSYSHVGQDVVMQLICGAGMRIKGVHSGLETTSVFLGSPDPNGMKLIVTAVNNNDSSEPPQKKHKSGENDSRETFDHFRAEHIHRFMNSQSGRQGVGALCFEVHGQDELHAIHSRYQTLHPKLVCHGGIHSYELSESTTVRVLHVAAYYGYDKHGKPLGGPDLGTMLRFIQIDGDKSDVCVLPGIASLDDSVEFSSLSHPTYPDHWVSNVFNRNEFLATLQATLGFTPKVDFNAGVVAAGEAIIESTVTGNTTHSTVTTPEKALTNNAQVYLPINNALSEVGHVHLFLREIGQGVQHIASRVNDLCSLVQTANDIRKVTGAGFSFLHIPRSYYGRLTIKDIALAPSHHNTNHNNNNDNHNHNQNGHKNNNGQSNSDHEQTNGQSKVSEEEASVIYNALVDSGHVTITGIVDINLTSDVVRGIIHKTGVKIGDKETSVVEAVLRGRYINMYKFLGDHVDEEAYLKIVRNQVLVDIQGQDVLYQIFTSCILQRGPNEEAPFIEYIQRVCSQQSDAQGNPLPIKPGCGGFGIRNFLTLFLSIEVSKAMGQVEAAKDRGDHAAANRAQRMVDEFTAQLDESNPILTSISDAMTAEGDALDQANRAQDPEAKQALLDQANEFRQKKLDGQEALKVCSDKYKKRMETLRLEVVA
eukprot:c20277_g1_i1.p1 GENE.c20277_g1_i1~~c20277_g1_i1.p1  ORF type:complete len:711 (-),score=184.33 c20277_g1_i1:51-2183(-)